MNNSLGWTVGGPTELLDGRRNGKQQNRQRQMNFQEWSELGSEIDVFCLKDKRYKELGSTY